MWAPVLCVEWSLGAGGDTVEEWLWILVCIESAVMGDLGSAGYGSSAFTLFRAFEIHGSERDGLGVSVGAFALRGLSSHLRIRILAGRGSSGFENGQCLLPMRYAIRLLTHSVQPDEQAYR